MKYNKFMNVKRWLLSGLAAFAVVFLLDWLIHGRLLMGLYTATASVWRPHAESCPLFWLMTVGQLALGLVFAWIYTKGYEAGKPGLQQGLRYGFLIGLLIGIPYVSVWYVVLPIPFALAAGWAASAFADSLIAGAVVGLLYKP